MSWTQCHAILSQNVTIGSHLSLGAAAGVKNQYQKDGGWTKAYMQRPKFRPDGQGLALTFNCCVHGYLLPLYFQGFQYEGLKFWGAASLNEWSSLSEASVMRWFIRCKVFTLLSSFSLITIELEPDILYINWCSKWQLWWFMTKGIYAYLKLQSHACVWQLLY